MEWVFEPEEQRSRSLTSAEESVEVDDGRFWATVRDGTSWVLVKGYGSQ